MTSLDSSKFKKLIHKSAALRGSGKFQEAIILVESTIPFLDNDSLFIAYKEIFDAYREMGNVNKTTEFAKIIAQIYPDLPSIQPYL